MSGIISSATIALTSVATVFAASLPEISQALAPVFENGNEYAANAMGLLIAIPGIALLTLIAGAARD
jgi:hypothetical protein